MADRSAIEWTDASWNPIRARATGTGKVGWFCTHVSEGCRNCYAEGINARLGTQVDYKPQALKPARDEATAPVALFLDETLLTQPLRWRQPRMIFVGSMTDVFADFVPDEWLDRIFAVMALAPQHTFQLLSKRPERMRAYLQKLDADRLGRALRGFHHAGEPATRADRFIALPLKNVWLGVSAEDQAAANARIPILLETPAAVRWLSAEPLLGPIDLTGVMAPPSWVYQPLRGVRFDPQKPPSYGDEEESTSRLDWVVPGGESGRAARPMHPAWVRQLRDQCADDGVPFLFKQWGQFAPAVSGATVMGATANIAWPDGTVRGGEAGKRGGAGTAMLPLGKKAAGRLLDGVLHDAYPVAR